MQATDVVGWLVGETYYCNDCTPTNECDSAQNAGPVYADSTTDCYHHCEVCEELILETLTDAGVADVMDAFERYLVRRAGRPEILRQWAKATKGWLDELNTLADLVWDATSDESLALTKVNVCRHD